MFMMCQRYQFFWKSVNFCSTDHFCVKMRVSKKNNAKVAFVPGFPMFSYHSELNLHSVYSSLEIAGEEHTEPEKFLGTPIFLMIHATEMSSWNSCF